MLSLTVLLILLFVAFSCFAFPLAGDDAGEEASEGILDSREKNLYDFFFFLAKWKTQTLVHMKMSHKLTKDQQMLISLFLLHLYLLAIPMTSVSQHLRKVN